MVDTMPGIPSSSTLDISCLLMEADRSGDLEAMALLAQESEDAAALTRTVLPLVDTNLEDNIRDMQSKITHKRTRISDMEERALASRARCSQLVATGSN